jgi:hypothetical protein
LKPVNAKPVFAEKDIRKKPVSDVFSAALSHTKVSQSKIFVSSPAEEEQKQVFLEAKLQSLYKCLPFFAESVEKSL